MIKLRLAEPWEQYPLRCCSRRGPKSKLECEKPALHLYWEAPDQQGEHAARNARGHWAFWRESRGAFEERVGIPSEPVVLSS